MSDAAEVAARTIAAAVLLVAGASKVVAPGPITTTLRLLLPRARLDRHHGLALGGGEVVLALGVAMVPSDVTGWAVAVWGAGMAAVGVTAIRSGGSIPCNCFGASTRDLGPAQLLQAPAWFVVAWLTATGSAATAGAERVAVLAAALVLALVAVFVRLVRVVKRPRSREADMAPALFPTRPAHGLTS